MILYKSIGSLLKDLRASKTKKDMADWISTDVRVYTRWENNNNKISDLEHVANITKIPLEVLFRLNNGYPTLYNISTRRYSLCPFDRDYVNKKILHQELFDSSEVGNITSFVSNEKIKKEKKLEIDFPYYPYEKQLNSSLLYQIAFKLPDLNLVINDPMGYYSGHLICIPIIMDTYEKLKTGRIAEYEITANDLADHNCNEPIAFHILSLFATNTSYVYCLSKRLICFLLTSVPKRVHPNSLISRYIFTNDGQEYCRKFDMELVRHSFDDFEKYKPETIPHFFEVPINKLEWLHAYRKKFGQSYMANA